jgi:hypothetical protein
MPVKRSARMRLAGEEVVDIINSEEKESLGMTMGVRLGL